ncbi:FtsJ-like methyltransferase family protein [Tritrichomonas foetus]|uniref:Cap-specific mRNA (nucleoside-2'-O-)-methyltransferase 1 n=1 Tax=Tritrichomonas foetus TaxID=1144522 RepID=A0A1J4L639_9EUKA|nr:FtsJ-like methyltransferase family protein [Tritrichomonas foetus]|eukprot:OHT17413.1 FtsJ-like methyltransferase family protein [Tritrichomonas foetus]
MNDLLFPFVLYSQDDPDYTNMPSISPYRNDMPSKAFWEIEIKGTKRKGINKDMQAQLYTDQDPYYNSMPGESPFRTEMPNKNYWINYQRMADMTKEQGKRKEIVHEFRIGVQILMNLGGRENPEFMAQQNIYEMPKDLADGSGLAYVLDDELEKLKPEVKRRDRFVPHKQEVEIIDCKPCENEIVESNIVLGEARSDLGHSNYCEQSHIDRLFKKKELFQPLSEYVFEQARRKSNQYEKIGKAIFMNRAAVKMANIDALFNLTNTPEFGIPSFTDVSQNELFYFADICAGPGGFTDYLYWRLGDRARGFGMTLKGDHDWAPNSRFLTNVSTFVKSYGEDGTGNIFKVDNLAFFKDQISNATKGKMLSLVTADGGIAVDGQENDQEMLLKRLVMCQFFCALAILRKGGNFVCKVFDVFTDFSASLLYIVAQCFEKFCIVKPYTSRPANSERYVVFLKLNRDPSDVINVLAKANETFQEFERTRGNTFDIMSLFPIEKIPSYFGQYLKKSNEELVRSQTDGVDEFLCYAYDLNMEPLDQDGIAFRCLKEWRVPRNKLEDTEMKMAKSKQEALYRQQQHQQQPQQQYQQQHQQHSQQQQQQQQYMDSMQKPAVQEPIYVGKEEIDKELDKEEEPDEDKMFTPLGSIIMEHMKRMTPYKGDIIRPLFTHHSKIPQESSTYFSFT